MVEGGRFDVVGGGASTLFEGALRQDWRSEELRCGWGCFDVVGGASTRLEAALRRGWRRNVDGVSGDVSTCAIPFIYFVYVCNSYPYLFGVIYN